MSEILQSPEELLEERHAEALAIASEAGHILLENGAEISRVEETMERIASHYGVDKKSFFVLSNGIFTTGSVDKVRQGGGETSSPGNTPWKKPAPN